jgi:maltose alpha-D-glucosyltransferase/alpha-amylase
MTLLNDLTRPALDSGTIAGTMASDPLWYKDAIIYQLHVKAFFDSSNDGIGDFEGLRRKLDYLQDLGVTTLWLLPFYPSPLRDDGYDISDYKNINPSYGKMADFKAFIRDAHRRDIRVITELIINHTSDQHPWFQRARRAKRGSKLRDFYVWSDTDQKFPETRIIFVDTEKSNWAWDPVAQAYYWHRFYSHQPDLNFDNPRVFRAVVDVMRFWLDLGVDGMRLDAVPYLIEREGTINENLPETHEVLRRLRHELDMRYGDRLLLAEANQWPEDVLQYFGAGDECHMAFHFPLMPRIYMAVATEDRHPIADIMRQTPDIPETCQWAVFLRNHDELTLEMVTDRERDYLWNYYAADRRARLNLGIRRRLAPLMENDRRKIELLNALLISMPGTPVFYYGDEIGMGDNVFLGDRDGVRTPMQWSFDRNGAALPAADHGSGLWFRGGQCRGAEPLAFVTLELGQAAHRGTSVATRFRPGDPAVSLPVEPQGHRLYPRLWRRNRPVRRQFVAHSASGRTRFVRVARPPTSRTARAQRLSANWRIAVSPYIARLQLLLVRAPAYRRRGR